MLKKLKRLDHRIVACLRDEYGLTVTKVTPLPVGVDRNAAVYRIDAEGGAAFFLKLRTGAFDEVCVALPKFLSDQGIKQIIAPLSTKAGRLSADLDDCRAILYPFVGGSVNASGRPCGQDGLGSQAAQDAAECLGSSRLA